MNASIKITRENMEGVLYGPMFDEIAKLMEWGQ